jgi:hypothetical protein
LSFGGSSFFGSSFGASFFFGGGGEPSSFDHAGFAPQRAIDDVDRELDARLVVDQHRDDLERAAIGLAVLFDLEQHVAGVGILVDDLRLLVDHQESHRGGPHVLARVGQGAALGARRCGNGQSEEAEHQ